MFADAVPGKDHEIDGGQLVLRGAKRFAYQALEAMAPDGITGRAARDHGAEACML